MFSFHATKLYQCIEGGMLSFKDSGPSLIFKFLKKFGFKNETEVVMPGTNAKMYEMQALIGSQKLKDMDTLVENRKCVYEIYHERLSQVPAISFNPEPESNVIMLISRFK